MACKSKFWFLYVLMICRNLYSEQHFYFQIYGVNLNIESTCRKIRTRKTSSSNTFHTVHVTAIKQVEWFSLNINSNVCYFVEALLKRYYELNVLNQAMFSSYLTSDRILFVLQISDILRIFSVICFYFRIFRISENGCRDFFSPSQQNCLSSPGIGNIYARRSCT